MGDTMLVAYINDNPPRYKDIRNHVLLYIVSVCLSHLIFCVLVDYAISIYQAAMF